jgi:hypothetical protein
LPQHPSSRPLRISVAAVDPASVAPPARLWRAEVDTGLRFGVWRLHPLVATGSIVLTLCAARLLLYWLLARGFGGLGHALCNYDCAWYEHTARAGYDVAPAGDRYADTANWAFFPLYPLLLAAASVLAPPDGMTWAGILLSTLCFAGFATLGGLYLQITEPGAQEAAAAAAAEPGPFAVPLAWLCLVSLWPGDLYFAFPYSEALYALLMTASLLALARRRLAQSAAWSAALSATRLPGIVMTPIIIAEGLRRLLRLHRAETLSASPATAIGQILLPIALAPLGLFAFMAYLRWHMGDGLAFVHVQSAWNRHAMPPWIVLWDGLTANDWGRVLAHPAGESLSLEAAVAVAGLILAGRQVLQRRYAEAWVIGATILLASSSGLQSLPRFVLTNPAVIFALYRLGTQGATRRRLILIGLALGLVQLLFVLAWFIGAPVLA